MLLCLAVLREIMRPSYERFAEEVPVGRRVLQAINIAVMSQANINPRANIKPQANIEQANAYKEEGHAQ